MLLLIINVQNGQFLGSVCRPRILWASLYTPFHFPYIVFDLKAGLGLVEQKMWKVLNLVFSCEL